MPGIALHCELVVLFIFWFLLSTEMEYSFYATSQKCFKLSEVTIKTKQRLKCDGVNADSEYIKMPHTAPQSMIFMVKIKRDSIVGQDK